MSDFATRSVINISYDNRLKNPFKGIDEFKAWFPHQKEIMYLLNDLSDKGLALRCNSGDEDVLQIYMDYLQGERLKEPVFVFGSNLEGRHGAAGAKLAVEYYGALYGVGEGLMGNSYAIPTKDKELNTLPLVEIERHIDAFVQHALTEPDTMFRVTRVGCGLAGYRDDQIAPLFLSRFEQHPSLSNHVSLPYHWLPNKPDRVVVSGSREIPYKIARRHYRRSLRRLVASDAVTIVGAARGVDVVVEDLCVRLKRPFTRIPPRWEKYGKIAGFVRNDVMLHGGNFLIALWDGESKGTISAVNSARAAKMDVHLTTYMKERN